MTPTVFPSVYYCYSPFSFQEKRGCVVDMVTFCAPVCVTMLMSFLFFSLSLSKKKRGWKVHKGTLNDSFFLDIKTNMTHKVPSSVNVLFPYL